MRTSQKTSVFGAPLVSLACWQGWSTAGPSHVAVTGSTEIPQCREPLT
jgi:hypothetical protein